MIKTEGLQFLFELANGEQSKPGSYYYIGLCEDAEDEIADTASLLDLTELSGNGYARQQVAADSTGMISDPYGTDGRAIITESVTFTAAGGAWNLAKTRFLATTSDDSGKLIATDSINNGAGVTLGDGQSYRCNIAVASEP